MRAFSANEGGTRTRRSPWFSAMGGSFCGACILAGCRREASRSLRRSVLPSHPARPMTIRIEVQRVERRGEPLPLPSYATPGSAGLDLPADAPVTLRPGQRALVPTGLAIAVPPGYEAQVRPRSGLALRNGVTCLNTPGTIDSDYRGEVCVILVNLGQEEVALASGSGGNTAFIEAGGARVLVDAGLSYRETRRRCADAGLDLREVTDVLLTHEHADHCFGAATLARKLGARVHATRGTLHALRD